MRKKESKKEMRKAKQLRLRDKVKGTDEKPRLTVFKSLNHLYVQLIDDVAGHTLVSTSTLSKDYKGKSKKTGVNTETAKAIGKILAEKAKEKNIAAIRFDRNGYKYHGNIKMLADTLRESGIKF